MHFPDRVECDKQLKQLFTSDKVAICFLNWYGSEIGAMIVMECSERIPRINDGIELNLNT